MTEENTVEAIDSERGMKLSIDRIITVRPPVQQEVLSRRCAGTIIHDIQSNRAEMKLQQEPTETARFIIVQYLIQGLFSFLSRLKDFSD